MLGCWPVDSNQNALFKARSRMLTEQSLITTKSSAGGILGGILGLSLSFLRSGTNKQMGATHFSHGRYCDVWLHRPALRSVQDKLKP